ncbi:hypothetical protein GCM10020220_114990 [Nonomuraea rubra]
MVAEEGAAADGTAAARTAAARTAVAGRSAAAGTGSPAEAEAVAVAGAGAAVGAAAGRRPPAVAAAGIRAAATATRGAAGAGLAPAAGVDIARSLSPCLPFAPSSEMKAFAMRLVGPLPNLGQKHTDLSPVTDVAVLGYSPKSFEVISAISRSGRRALS